jgi:SARP family transcriptional regulator, regulator of embCAB operon
VSGATVFRLLGPVTVSQDGREVTLDGMKQRTMLAALLMARGRLVFDSQIIWLLWGHAVPKTVDAQVYTYASRIRKRLGADRDLVRQGPGYLLRGTGHVLDVAEFARLAGRGHAALREGRCGEAADLLRTALTWWRGPALADVTQRLRDAEADELDEARMAVLEDRIEAELGLGDHAPLVSELSGLVRRHPLRERLRAHLMTALYGCGRRGDALAVYAEGRRILVEELGVDPGPQLAATHQAVLRGEPVCAAPAIDSFSSRSLTSMAATASRA